MKVFIVLAVAFVACASASHLAGYGAVSTGTSTQFRSEDNYGNYQFGYDEAHATGSTSRREEEHNGIRRGSYSLTDADGRRRTVNYVADAEGFRASVHTNEPGVEPKDPADVLINKEAAIAYAAPVAVAAPAPLPAPVAFAAPAPIAVKSYAAPVVARPLGLPIAPAPVYAPAPVAPAPVYAPAAPAVIEAPAPRAFSYSFGSTHHAVAAPVLAAPAPIIAPAPIAAPAPIYQHGLKY